MRRVVPTLASAVLVIAGACDHPHAHDEAGGHGAPAGDELPGQSVTLWTERTELFMEHDPFIVGQEVSFAAHVTALPSFKAVTAGACTLTLTMADGHELTGRAERPTNPGIFRPVLKPDRAGKCELSMQVEGPQVTDSFPVGSCVVFADEAAARAALGEEEPASGRISFLKEQQWKTEFANAPVEERELQPSLRAYGEIRPVAGKEARIAAPSAGRVELPPQAPALGMRVDAGQLLATVYPRLAAGADRASLEAERQAGRVELDAAESQLARADRLFAEKAVPEKALEEARARVAVARARLDAASGRLEQFSAGAAGLGGSLRGAQQVRAPIAGTLVAVGVAAGETVEEGRALFTVIDLARVWLQAGVFEPDIPQVREPRAAWFTIDGYESPFVVDDTNGRLIAVGAVIDPKTRTLPVVFELANPDGRLRIGQFANVRIASGAPVRGLAVPRAALVDEAGRAIAYVQVEGEAFERRPLITGVEDRGWVQVVEGLAAGERIVTRGAYEIRLTAASGIIPAHGHAH